MNISALVVVLEESVQRQTFVPAITATASRVILAFLNVLGDVVMASALDQTNAPAEQVSH